ncbi:unnamed protein product [Clonostachys byssicola]|uniref:Major facilitator superfamily (MFS) profile domain-containing protein n=1 Tax=Clonostachys byssicola TaxID=160290 RepID=A0A9N9XX55_9HYPO|nr:unnamed protein product [Clonostachys byssicola]
MTRAQESLVHCASTAPSSGDRRHSRQPDGAPSLTASCEEVSVPTERTPLLQHHVGDGELDLPHASKGKSNTYVSSTAVEASDDDEDDASGDRQFMSETDYKRFIAIFLVLMLTHFIACFDGTIMASSHPVITSYFKSSNSASWLSTAFLLTSSAFQPVVGRLSDAVGRKPIFVGGLGIFTLATMWCALAQSMLSFIFARAACGLGAGSMMSMVSIMMSDLVPIERRGIYQSYVNITYGIASSSGAAMGGFMADTLGWRWEFGIQVFPLIICLSIAMFIIPSDLGLQSKGISVAQAMGSFDFLGSFLLTTSTTFLILGLAVGGNTLPWSHPLTVSSLVIFGICFPVCLWVESRAKLPVMPLNLLHSRPRANIIFSNFVAAFLMNAILFNAPLYFQAVLLTSATTSGLYLVVPTAVASLTGTATGFLVTYTRRLKWPIMSGTICYLLGTSLLCCMHRGLPSVVYLLLLFPCSAGQGFQFPGSFIAVLAASAQEEQAVVSSTLMLWRSIGSVLGIGATSLIVQNSLLSFLHQYITINPTEGRDDVWKAAIIERVRGSIESVAKLDKEIVGTAGKIVKEQVIQSYADAIRITFLCCVGLAVVNFLLIAPIKLPRLGSKK